MKPIKAWLVLNQEGIVWSNEFYKTERKAQSVVANYRQTFLLGKNTDSNMYRSK